MLFKTRSAAVYGIEAYVVDVEVNISTGESGKFLFPVFPMLRFVNPEAASSRRSQQRIHVPYQASRSISHPPT